MAIKNFSFLLFLLAISNILFAGDSSDIGFTKITGHVRNVDNFFYVKIEDHIQRQLFDTWQKKFPDLAGEIPTAAKIVGDIGAHIAITRTTEELNPEQISKLKPFLGTEVELSVVEVVQQNDIDPLYGLHCTLKIDDDVLTPIRTQSGLSEKPYGDKYFFQLKFFGVTYENLAKEKISQDTIKDEFAGAMANMSRENAQKKKPKGRVRGTLSRVLSKKDNE